MQTEAATKVEPMARIMRVGETLVFAKKNHRCIFESPDEPNTTVVPVLGALLEFTAEIKAGMLTFDCAMLHIRRCIFRQLWLSSVTGERKDVLEFEHMLVYVDQFEVGQKVRVLKMP